MNDELGNLNTIETNSRRGGGQGFDLQHDIENQRFTVADAFYTKEDMNNHGFTAHFNPDNGQAYLSIHPNNGAVSYKGREGHTKGDQFKSTSMSELFEKIGLEGNLALEHVGEKEGVTYYRVEDIEDTDEEPEEPQDTVNEAQSEEIDEELAAEDTEDVEEEVAMEYDETLAEDNAGSF